MYFVGSGFGLAAMMVYWKQNSMLEASFVLFWANAWCWFRFRLAGDTLFFARPKKSVQKKGRPHSLKSCVSHKSTRLRKLAALKQSSAYSLIYCDTQRESWFMDWATCRPLLLTRYFVGSGFALAAMYFSLLCQRKVHKRKAARISFAPPLLANKGTFGNSLRSNSPRFNPLFTSLLGGDDGIKEQRAKSKEQRAKSKEKKQECPVHFFQSSKVRSWSSFPLIIAE